MASPNQNHISEDWDILPPNSSPKALPKTAPSPAAPAITVTPDTPSSPLDAPESSSPAAVDSTSNNTATPDDRQARYVAYCKHIYEAAKTNAVFAIEQIGPIQHVIPIGWKDVLSVIGCILIAALIGPMTRVAERRMELMRIEESRIAEYGLHRQIHSTTHTTTITATVVATVITTTTATTTSTSTTTCAVFAKPTGYFSEPEDEPTPCTWDSPDGPYPCGWERQDRRPRSFVDVLQARAHRWPM